MCETRGDVALALVVSEFNGYNQDCLSASCSVVSVEDFFFAKSSC